MQPRGRSDQSDTTRGLRQEVTDGLLYACSRLNADTGKTRKATSFPYAVVKLLSAGNAAREGMLWAWA
jgi:hypothetical protein